MSELYILGGRIHLTDFVKYTIIAVGLFSCASMMGYGVEAGIYITGFTAGATVFKFFSRSEINVRESHQIIIQTIQSVEPPMVQQENIPEAQGSTEIILKELRELVTIGSISQAMQRAKHLQDEGYEAALWTLGESLKDIGKYEEAYNAYNAIPDGNHYAERAAFEMLHLRQFCIPNEHESIESQLLFLNELLCMAVKAGPMGQELTDRFFYRLCGGAEFMPDISSVKAEADTLIRIAEKMRLSTIQKVEDTKEDDTKSLVSK